MRELLNQHSFLVLGALLLLVTAPLALRYAPGVWRWGLPGLLILGLLLVQAALRHGDTEMRSGEAVRVALVSGQPTLLEIYSDF